MSAPSLPDTFGNYALGDLVEVASPPAVSWLPQTVGWWWLGAAILGLLGYRAWKVLRHWYRNRYRREALQRLRQLAAGNNTGALVGDINRLLKLTALAAFSREQVARLSGKDWVDFLNRQCPQAPFSAAQGELLALAAYRPGAADASAEKQLLTASLNWVREHENAFDD